LIIWEKIRDPLWPARQDGVESKIYI